MVCRSNYSIHYYDPPLLYDLNSDPGELYNLDVDKYTEVLATIEKVRFRCNTHARTHAHTRTHTHTHHEHRSGISTNQLWCLVSVRWIVVPVMQSSRVQSLAAHHSLAAVPLTLPSIHTGRNSTNHETFVYSKLMYILKRMIIILHKSFV